MTIEPQIKNYIDETVKVAVNSAVDESMKRVEARFTKRMEEFFDTNIKHHIGLLKEYIGDQIALVIEVTKDKPGREEVREIARDELRYHGLHR